MRRALTTGTSLVSDLKSFNNWLRSQEFYELCQRYRHARDVVAAGSGLPTASEAFEELQREILVQAQRQLRGLEAFKRSVEEALNQGDGSYRP